MNNVPPDISWGDSIHCNKGGGKWNNLQLSRLLGMAEASGEPGVAAPESRAERVMNRGSGTIVDIQGK